ncbi:hypothetical protein [Stigmatella erecta]|uniref:Uncharacterized protein n=1 Tax=Stigmatella erecta TaxID=83460 RepID=A0A1I0L9Z9_9BACT|nr:hypothetical protein [Stigmatella erecta]SEU36932.1 hypothetical protein SAMN05443639_12316 [Stigmatella erecta]
MNKWVERVAIGGVSFALGVGAGVLLAEMQQEQAAGTSGAAKPATGTAK